MDSVLTGFNSSEYIDLNTRVRYEPHQLNDSTTNNNSATQKYMQILWSNILSVCAFDCGLITIKHKKKYIYKIKHIQNDIKNRWNTISMKHQPNLTTFFFFFEKPISSLGFFFFFYFDEFLFLKKIKNFFFFDDDWCCACFAVASFIAS